MNLWIIKQEGRVIEGETGQETPPLERSYIKVVCLTVMRLTWFLRRGWFDLQPYSSTGASWGRAPSPSARPSPRKSFLWQIRIRLRKQYLNPTHNLTGLSVNYTLLLINNSMIPLIRSTEGWREKKISQDGQLCKLASVSPTGPAAHSASC